MGGTQKGGKEGDPPNCNGAKRNRVECWKRDLQCFEGIVGEGWKEQVGSAIEDAEEALEGDDEG